MKAILGLFMLDLHTMINIFEYLSRQLKSKKKWRISLLLIGSLLIGSKFQLWLDLKCWLRHGASRLSNILDLSKAEFKPTQYFLGEVIQISTRFLFFSFFYARILQNAPSSLTIWELNDALMTSLQPRKLT